MNKKIKVIELLKQMEIKENLPKQIKYKNKVFDLSCSDDGIHYYANENWSMMSWIDNFYQLYDYVEILEDEEDDNISSLNAFKLMEAPYMAKCLDKNSHQEFMEHLKQSEVEIVHKIGELIEKVNELDKKINKED